ncbi:MAG TPA: peptidase M18 [Terracidiphilus sp.]|jgi:aspartyl aminopeptidase|nr:peptidase M18 [Terracidiphilus sp.]
MRKRFLHSALSLLLCASFAAAQKSSVWDSKKSSWLLLTPEQHIQVFHFADDYKHYMSLARTAELSTEEVTREAKAAGFAEFTDPAQVKPGAKLILTNRDRAIILAVIGSAPLTQSSRLIGTHQDSPHIDLKPRPIDPAGSTGFALFKTRYYGGIEKYQWANVPLALIGRIDTEDGRKIDVSIGLDPKDPIFLIPANAPHSDSELRSRTYSNILTGEELDPVAGSVPSDDGSVTEQVTRTLTEKFKIKEEDLVSAELALVPAFQPRDLGIDNGLVAAWGQDDKLSSFCAARALIETTGTPKHTALAYLTNFEEVGSVNNTGAGSQFLTASYSRLTAAQRGSSYNDVDLRDALHNAQVISSDTNDGENPIFQSTQEPTNAARLSYGVTIKEYGEGFNANSEYVAHIRALLDQNQIPWQTQMPKVDVGGGGTIGGFMSREDMEVIDVGIPLLSMHATVEGSSKVDLWNLYRFFKVFYQSQ